MRDPMNWAIPVFRAFGIPVKVHIFFFLVTLGLFLRYVMLFPHVWWVDIFLFVVVTLFGIVLLHEFGHCFGGRAVGGEATEVLIWPLGGLAFVDVPHNWRAHTVTAAAGPAVNVALCVLTAGVLIGAGFWPALNPLYDPYRSELKNYRDGRVYTSDYDIRLYKPGTTERADTTSEMTKALADGKSSDLRALTAPTKDSERALAPTWVVWVNRVFWLSWVLLLLNLIPAYPLDGGQIMQGLIWWRTDYRQGTAVAAYTGYVVAVLALIASIAFNEVMVVCLGMFVFYCSAVKLRDLAAEEGLYGDFSAGYTSLEEDEPPPPRPKKVNPVKRWLQARAARRIQREIEQRQQDDERMDQLLEKIQRSGKESLSDEEKRFMARVSERYRNRS